MGKSKFYTKNSKHHYIADFETITNRTQYFKTHNDTRVILWGMCSLDRESKGVYLGTSIDSFFNLLFKIGKSATIFFHNLSFDGDFILKYLLNVLNYELNSDKDGAQNVDIFKKGNRIYYIKVSRRYRDKKGKTKRQTIIFRCSLLLLSASVEMMGKSYQIEKHDDDEGTFYDYEPFNSINDVPPKFIEYLKRDLKIVKIAFNDFIETINNLKVIKKYKKYSSFNILNFLTAASLTLKILKIYLKSYNFRRSEKNQINIYMYPNYRNFK